MEFFRFYMDFLLNVIKIPLRLSVFVLSWKLLGNPCQYENKSIYITSSTKFCEMLGRLGLGLVRPNFILDVF